MVVTNVDPVPGEPAALARLPDEHALVIADYHAGIHRALRYEKGIEIASRADARRERVVRLIDQTHPDRLVILGDVMHSIGDPGWEERDELETLLEEIDIELTIAKGNHDGNIEAVVGNDQVGAAAGFRLGDVGFVHGHTWPSGRVLGANTVCIGHEHPSVRLRDEVGGGRIARVWLRGELAKEPFVDHGVIDADEAWTAPELVVFPAFNTMSGRTVVNVDDQEFLCPFLPEGLTDGIAYLLDGTRLGTYYHV